MAKKLSGWIVYISALLMIVSAMLRYFDIFSALAFEIILCVSGATIIISLKIDSKIENKKVDTKIPTERIS